MKNILLCLLFLLRIQSSNANSDWWEGEDVLSAGRVSSNSNHLLRGREDTEVETTPSAVNDSTTSRTLIQEESSTTMQLPMFINCGSSQTATDSTGQEWQPDTFYQNGVASSTLTAIFENGGAIFQTMRTTWQFWGLLPHALKYDIAVPPPADAQFAVTLYFTEQFNFWAWLFSFGGSTTRVNVLLQGELVWDQLELVADTDNGTAKRALRRESTVTSSSDGQIQIEVQSNNGDPTLSGIVIHALVPGVVR